MANSNYHYIGIDVGTGSVRAALVKHDGTLLASSTQATVTYRDEHDHRIFEQSTTDIWSGISKVVQAVLKDSKLSAADVKGIGFDATCSLAVTDWNGDPVVVTKGGDLGTIGERNIVLWADHRAEEEAELINGTGSIVLDYVGGTMSVSPPIFDTETGPRGHTRIRNESALSFPGSRRPAHVCQTPPRRAAKTLTLSASH